MAETLRFRVLRQAQDERVIEIENASARAELVEARLAAFALEAA